MLRTWTQTRMIGSWSVGLLATLCLNVALGGEPAEPEFSPVAFCSDDACTDGCNLGAATCSDGLGYDFGCADGACSLDCGPECCDTGCCDTGYCDLGCCDPCCVEPWMHRDGVYGTFLYLHPVGADMHHAQQQNGTGGAGTTPFGEIGVVDPHHEPGVRLGGTLALGPCSSIAASYTYLETDSVSQLLPPAGVGGGLGTVGSLVHHPQADITSSAGPVDAFYNIDLQMADAEYRRLFRASNCSWMNYSVGARYGRLEQNFRQFGNYGGSQGGAIDTSTEIDFDGAGIKFGLDGERKLGSGQFSAYGNTSLSTLFGSFRGDYRMHNATTVSDLAIVRWEDDRVTPMLEYEFGVAWTSCSGSCRASFGYMGIHWFNVVTTPEFVDAVQADNYVDIGDTLSFDGLTSKVEWRF